MLNVGEARTDDVLTVIFTSGSTGQPKGVMLTHGNVAHNIAAIEEAVRLKSSDVLVGVLPFFHSFGYTVTLWAVMGIDVAGIYHFNPLDAKQVSKLCRQHGGTVLLATPTFLRTYVRRCEKEDLQSLEIVVTGAEKLPKDVADAFEAKFGVRPMEGYGTTELSPLVSVNIPPNRSTGDAHLERRDGTVGRPVREVRAKTVNRETGKDLPPGEPGMLYIAGPNVMKGYLGRDDLTAEVIKDGWYVTGDIAVIDEDGFIRITGRESRFSKIGGEMVPHIQIEETLAQVVGLAEDGNPRVAVTAVPDARKGERLVVVHTSLDRTPEELNRALSTAGLPNLYIPSPDSYIQTEQLPILAPENSICGPFGIWLWSGSGRRGKRRQKKGQTEKRGSGQKKGTDRKMDDPIFLSVDFFICVFLVRGISAVRSAVARRSLRVCGRDLSGLRRDGAGPGVGPGSGGGPCRSRF